MSEKNIDQIYERTYAVIDLSAIRGNVESAKASLPAGMQFCAILKCDGYGHGAPPIARELEDLVDMFGVATIAEGYALRRNGIRKPILDLGVAPARSYRLMLEQNIMPSVFTLEQAREISALAGSMGCAASYMIPLDTGMGRIGIQTEEPDALSLALEIVRFPNMKLSGVFTHFASADECDKSFAELQLQRFTDFTDRMEAAGVSIPIRHAANSAGIVEQIGTGLTMVRDGICLYGLLPSAEVDQKRLVLTPALSWKAKLTHVKTVPAGTPISYGSSFVTEKETEIATIPVGYGDGFPRALSNRADVLIRGRRCRILGRVCMDQFMVDVSGLFAEVGDIVTLLGTDGTERIDLYEWADFGLFPYEVLCNIGKRVPRVYVRDGAWIGNKDIFRELYPDMS